ncbi:DUF433 domain-containing protein [Cryobacterium glaciale]|uniref:DUF433 domain-containing protein n=1 Tax=Cryobacterium glaciale TaxID=1259145 RepID=A0A4R8UW26_9MICO|nr:DUF433 domain-containing protein [Cryobacterium glaciale]TFB71566.1 DUF433 domain-containing protein [Cryobacterium glaciale]
MSFPLALAAVLTGATNSQLRSWKSKGLIVPEISASRPLLYSFRDLVWLRTLVFLRSRTSLQRISVARVTLDLVDLTDHPSKYRFATDGKTIVVDDGAGQVIDLVRRPGQADSFTFEEISEAFQDFRGRDVVDFRRPSKHIEVELRRLGGWPTIEGTRIPYDLVNGLVDNRTLFARDIPDYYPSVSVEAAEDAILFAEKVRMAGVR